MISFIFIILLLVNTMNYMELFDVFIRAITSLIVLFVASKMLGKKQVSELSIFDYVIGISIGNFAAEVTLNLESKIINGALAVLLFGFIVCRVVRISYFTTIFFPF